MNHGAGGEVMEDLIKDTILGNVTKKAVNDGIGLDSLDDGATIPLGNKHIVITTDGHTVNPLFFPAEVILLPQTQIGFLKTFLFIN